MSRPHPAQIRLLSFLRLAPADRFVDFAQIDQAWQVQPGDELFIPSLVVRGWAEMGPQQQACVRIPEAGSSLLIMREITGDTGI